jgi:hypothetical protein
VVRTVGSRIIALRNTALATGALGAYMFADRRWGEDFSGLGPLVNKGLGEAFDGLRKITGNKTE